MARFKFRLRPVHELRKYVEQEQMDILAQERLTLAQIQDEIRNLREKYEFWARKYIQSAEAGVSPAQVVQMLRYIEELGKLIDRQETQEAKQTVKVEEARLELIERMKDRKTLDVLLEKQQLLHRKTELAKEEKEIEEIVTGGLGKRA